MDKLLAKKFKIKPGYSLLILNSPKNFNTSTASIKLAGGKYYDFVLLFVTQKADLDKFSAKAVKALKEDGLLWIAYPKKTSAIKTDVSRDHGWENLTAEGYEVVAAVAIDETWSSLRFRLKEKTSVKTKDEKSALRKKFTAELESPEDGIDATYVSVPFNVESVFGSNRQIKVKAWFNSHPYRGILANMGTGCHVIIVRKDIRLAIGKNVGDKITVELERDTEERIVDVPDDLQKVLNASRKAQDFFDTLSYTNRKEYAGWITSAKKTETRNKRLSDTITKLLQGKKNPSQK